MSRYASVAWGYDTGKRVWKAGQSKPDRIESLKARVNVSRPLGSMPSPKWNAVTQRDQYFQMTASLVANPQNYKSAEQLGEMHKLLVEKLIPKNVETICATQRDSDLRGYSLARFELMSRIEEAPKLNCIAKLTRVLKESWRTDYVGCVLMASRRTGESYDFMTGLPNWDGLSCIEDDYRIFDRSESIADLDIRQRASLGAVITRAVYDAATFTGVDSLLRLLRNKMLR